MRLIRAIGVIGVSCVLESGCAASGNYQPATYVVRPHDTLYTIAWRYDLDYRDLARWNNIGPDYRIAVGQVLLLKPSSDAWAPRPASSAPAHPQDAPHVSSPKPLGNPAPAASALAEAHPPATGSAVADARPPTTGSAPSTTNVHPPSRAPASGGIVTAAMQWVWPTQRSSAPRPVPGGGILLLGQIGQPIHAACTGRVVYIGSGLRGYGNLIIIKHGDNLLSAYAHNRELLVHEGQEVIGGQDIARMGTGPHQIAALYFEIRLNGKPVDPLRYLSGMK